MTIAANAIELRLSLRLGRLMTERSRGIAADRRAVLNLEIEHLTEQLARNRCQVAEQGGTVASPACVDRELRRLRHRLDTKAVAGVTAR